MGESKDSNSTKFSKTTTDAIFDQLKLNEKIVSRDEWHYGVNIELEHGTEYPKSNITQNDPILTAKIALAHVQEYPDYYKYLKIMEDFLEEQWKNKQKNIFV